MKTKKLNRELNFLLSTNELPISVFYFGEKFIEFKVGKLKNAKEVSESIHYPSTYKKTCQNFVRIFELANIIGLTDDELHLRWVQLIRERREQIVDFKKKPIPEGRDNKGVFVGSGGYNKNMVRYPSKKRSKRVWKIFYEMFPYYAKRDGWDGETSNRMK